VRKNRQTDTGGTLTRQALAQVKNFNDDTRSIGRRFSRAKTTRAQRGFERTISFATILFVFVSPTSAPESLRSQRSLNKVAVGSARVSVGRVQDGRASWPGGCGFCS